MASTTTITPQNTPSYTPQNPVSNEPGMIMNLSFGGGNYKLLAYYEDSRGTKTYLPANTDPQAMEKIRGLAWGLLNAHDSRRISLNESPYEVKVIDANGLIKADNSIISHDFDIAPITPQFFANQMATSLTNCGHPIQSTAIKARDIWNTMEDVISRATNQPPSQQPRIDTNPVPTQIPTTLPSPVSNSSNLQNPVTTANSNLPIQTPSAITQTAPLSRPVTSVEIDLNVLNPQRADWYEQIGPRPKLRIINDILNARSSTGGIYQRVWEHFAAQGHQPISAGSILQLLEQEKQRLQTICNGAPSQIPILIRREANRMIEAFYIHISTNQLQDQIRAFIIQDFACKDALFQQLRQQAVAEGVRIDDWDAQWSQNHYLDDNRRFIQALCGWLDNN